MEPPETKSKPSTLPPWEPSWQAPAMMLLGLLAGVGFGVGHHEYYRSFDNTVVQSTNQQQWAVRVGTGLAFLTKTAFTSVVAIAFTQYLWVIARKKSLSIQSLDDMFSMTANPLSFFNFSLLASAKLLTIVGVVSWLIPLVATVTPATLTVENRLTSNITSREVPYPDYTDYKTKTTGDVTRFYGNVWGDYVEEYKLHSASPALTRLLAAVSSGMNILPVSAPYPNSSYSIRFYGPCLKCQSLDDALLSKDFDNFAKLAPQSNNHTTLEKAASKFVKPKENEYYNAEVGDGGNYMFVASGYKNMSEVADLDRDIIIKNHTDGITMVCQPRNASYTVDFTSSQGILSTTMSSLNLEPVLDYSASYKFQDLPPYGRAYLSMMLALQKQLEGRVASIVGTEDKGMIGANLSVVSSGLLACPEIMDSYHANEKAKYMPPLNESYSPWMCRNGSLARSIEDLSHNFTLSLLSSASFSTLYPINVNVTFPLSYYSYQGEPLAISYLTALGVAVICFAVGSWACLVNGHSGNVSFATIMHTTRNSELDDLTTADRYAHDSNVSPWKLLRLKLGLSQYSTPSPWTSVKLKYGIYYGTVH